MERDALAYQRGELMDEVEQARTEVMEAKMAPTRSSSTKMTNRNIPFMVFSKYHLLIRTFSDAFFGNSQRNIRRILQKTCLHRTTFLNSAESGFLCVCKMKGTTHEIELNQKSAHSLVCATKLQTSVRVKTIIRSVPTDSI